MLDQLCLHCKIYLQQIPKRQIVRAAVTAVINTATATGNVSVNEELSERFRLPRGQIRGSTSLDHYPEESVVALCPILLQPRPVIKVNQNPRL